MQVLAAIVLFIALCKLSPGFAYALDRIALYVIAVIIVLMILCVGGSF